MDVLLLNARLKLGTANFARVLRRRAHRVARWGGAAVGALLTAGTLLTAACAPGQLSGENALPSGTPDPATVQTPDGALAFYRKTIATIPSWLDPLIVETGLLTDELVDLPISIFFSTPHTGVDSRTALGGDAHYKALHRLRAQARQARGFAASYLPDSLAVPLRGHLYALEGYAEIFLADLFCSGVPLSTVDYGADYTLAAGSTTGQVYAHAAALFDTALTLLGASDSVRLRYLAAVGRGRALLGADSVAAAAAAVAEVPDDFRYEVVFVDADNHVELLHQFATDKSGDGVYSTGEPSIGDREGVNGLDYRSSGDPRTPSTWLGQSDNQHDLYFPIKYPLDGPVPFRLADGIEARLIEAEAALRAGSGTWLTQLNALRTDGTFATRSTADPNDDPAATDTLWHAGTGGVDSLPPLADPGTSTGRVDLLFRERAFWLYLTGHRQGDLRRLIRQYQRPPEQVYPVGSYAGAGGAYGSQIVFPVPATEAQLNPKYTGCFHYGA